MAEKYVMAIDQGTTSSRAIVFNHEGRIVHRMNFLRGYIRDLAGRCVAVRRVGMDAITEFAGLNGEHPPELPAAKYADR